MCLGVDGCIKYQLEMNVNIPGMGYRDINNGGIVENVICADVDGPVSYRGNGDRAGKAILFLFYPYAEAA